MCAACHSRSPHRVLPPMERREEEEAAQLSRRVQLALAEELDVLGSEVTADDITIWMRGRVEDYRVLQIVCL